MAVVLFLTDRSTRTIFFNSMQDTSHSSSVLIFFYLDFSKEIKYNKRKKLNSIKVHIHSGCLPSVTPVL